MEYFTVYDLLKNLCKERKIKIKSIEQALGFSDGMLKKWKTHIPNVANLAAVADYLGVSIDTLVGRASGDYLSEDERQLLALFRSMNAEGKTFVMQLVETASERYKKTTASDREVTA